MGRRKNKPRWLHSCHKSHRTLVMQADECDACGRTRTVQAEIRYATFHRENAYLGRSMRSIMLKGGAE